MTCFPRFCRHLRLAHEGRRALFVKRRQLGGMLWCDGFSVALAAQEARVMP